LNNELPLAGEQTTRQPAEFASVWLKTSTPKWVLVFNHFPLQIHPLPTDDPGNTRRAFPRIG
jgi:hypothetical protein